jgi:hypothetical protein
VAGFLLMDKLDARNLHVSNILQQGLFPTSKGDLHRGQPGL